VPQCNSGARRRRPARSAACPARGACGGRRRVRVVAHHTLSGPWLASITPGRRCRPCPYADVHCDCSLTGFTVMCGGVHRQDETALDLSRRLSCHGCVLPMVRRETILAHYRLPCWESPRVQRGLRTVSGHATLRIYPRYVMSDSTDMNTCLLWQTRPSLRSRPGSEVDQRGVSTGTVSVIHYGTGGG
jgi:hypothetical protein